MAMGKAIAVSAAMVLIIGIIAFTVYRMSRKPPRGDLTSKEEYELLKMMHRAAGVMRRLGYQPDGNIDDSDILSRRSKQNIDKWLHEYEKYHHERRELNA
jgi:hypothetical protein